ncbi:GerW family sporulation protein [Natrononativus amylolyticus]|uniref:GerW family sporulation protein n=1 Tax=Natrononativus amylolyticus TaxID=2963434 RepID=UPI0020CD15E0|nr:spore germination protein GerW family protein [Natrononativus amylolyticus]
MGTFEALVDRVTGSMTVRTAFGEPITVDGRTIVPVAKVGYGFGGGFGPNETDEPTTDAEERASADAEERTSADAEDGGFGAGGAVRPAGVIEITDEETRFVPVRQGRWRLAVAAALCGLAAGWFVGCRRSRNP